MRFSTYEAEEHVSLDLKNHWLIILELYLNSWNCWFQVHGLRAKDHRHFSSFMVRIPLPREAMEPMDPSPSLVRPYARSISWKTNVQLTAS
jgi:hypothetical protein